MKATNVEERNRPLTQIYFYLTEGCNLACRHCWLNPKHQTKERTYSYLPVNLLQSIIEQGKPLGLERVKLTGGEPLMHPQIDMILEFIQKQEISLDMETNAVLCTPELARMISKCKKPSVSVSLDGVDAQTHEWVRCVPGCFDSTIQGIQNLTNAGLKPQIIMSIMRKNVSQMEPLIRLAESLGAGSVKFNLIQPTGRGENVTAGGETLSIEELIKLGHWVEDSLSASTYLDVYYDYPSAFRPLSKMFGNDGNGCSSCGILGIIGVLANGSYALCGIGTQVSELVFGDASTHRLEEVWNNNSILVELREGIPHKFGGICQNCLMKKFCIGDCIAQNYYRTKSIWGAFWFCEYAYESGLFPKSRMIN